MFVLDGFIASEVCYSLILQRKRKNKLRVKEFSLDPAKMTMRDLIRYLPESNPMT